MRGKRLSAAAAVLASVVLSSCSGMLSLDTLFNKTALDERVSESLASSLASRTVTLSDSSFRIVAVSDAHVSGSTWSEGEQLATWIASTASSSSPVRAVLLGGDLTDGGEEAQYSAVGTVLQSISALGVAVVPALGNHDLFTSSGWAYWKKYIIDGSSWYPSAGTVHFQNSSGTELLRVVILDSAECGVGSTQLSYLKGALSSSVPGIVFTHVPLVPGYSNSIWYLESDYERLAILSAMAAANAPMYLAGHDHTVSSQAVGSTTQVVMGSFSGSLPILVITVDSAGVSCQATTLPQ